MPGLHGVRDRPKALVRAEIGIYVYNPSRAAFLARSQEGLERVNIQLKTCNSAGNEAAIQPPRQQQVVCLRCFGLQRPVEL